MITIAIRETVVLLAGCLLAFMSSLIPGNANRDLADFISAILLPIVFCSIRASLVTPPDATLSGLRHLGYQLFRGIALILLLVYEMSLGMFFGAVDIPAMAWLIVSLFGMGYVLLFCIAFRIGSKGDLSRDLPIDPHVDTVNSAGLPNQ